MGHLTSSISSRETFLLSLLAMDAEPESTPGASVVGGFCWLPNNSCETCDVGCASAML